MNKFKIDIILFMLLITPVIINAQVLHGYTIKDVIVNTDKGMSFRTDETMVQPTGVTCATISWYNIDSSSKYETEMYSFILSAQAQQKKVTFYLNGCTAAGYPRVGYIY